MSLGKLPENYVFQFLDKNNAVQFKNIFNYQLLITSVQ